MRNMCHTTDGPSSSCEMIILQNKIPGNFSAMKSAIHASLFHCASSANRKLYLQHFPEGATSWCGYMRDQANQTNYYTHEAGLPLDIIAELKPIFARLGEVSLLSRCEALDAMFWERVLKSVFVCPETLQLGIYDAVAHFNIGCQAQMRLSELIQSKF